MCKDSQFITLLENDYSEVILCKKCKSYSLSYKTSCATFQYHELSKFSRMLTNLRKEDFCHYISGIAHVKIKNPTSHVGFCLSKSEVYDLIDITNQALLLQTSYEILES